MLKIDVEGAELRVLEGSREVLLQSKPIVIIGVHPYWLSGQDAGQIFALLAECGYTVKDSVVARTHGYDVGDYLCMA